MRNVASFPQLLDPVEYVLKITSCDNKAYFNISINHNMQIHFQQRLLFFGDIFKSHTQNTIH